MIRFLQTPGKAKKIVLGGLLLLICAAMVITLIPGGFLGDALGFSSGTQGVVATVGTQQVTTLEVQNQARRAMREQRNLPAELAPFFMQQALNQLILEKVLLSEADRMGIKVTNQELADDLKASQFGSILFPNGSLLPADQYEMFVQQNYNLTIGEFERLWRNDIIIRKLRDVVEGSVIVTDQDLRREFERLNTKVKFEYAVLDRNTIMQSIRPTESELQAYYDSHKAAYAGSVPERRKAEYVVISTSKLKSEIKVTPEEIKRYYTQHQDSYRVPDEVLVRHILIRTPAAGADGKVDPKALQEARTKAEGILKKLKGGANFADLAKKESQDPGSAGNGGELGWIQRGRTVPEFEKAAFSLNKGQLSDVVQTSFGLHIILVEDKHTARLKPLDEVTDQISAAIATEKASTAAESLANTVRSEARTRGLAEAALKHQLKVVVTPPVSRTDSLPEVGAAAELVEALFSAREKDPAEIARLPEGYAVYQVTQIIPPATPTFENIKDKLATDFKNDRAQELLAKRTQELSDRARAEHNLAKAAKELGATLKTSDLVTAEQQVPDIGSMSGPAAEVFGMKPGEISGPIAANTKGVVVHLLESQAPSTAEFDQQKESIREQLLEQQRNQFFQIFADSLKARMQKEGKIRINKEEYERLVPREAAS